MLPGGMLALVVLVALVGARPESSPWDWQKGTEDYASFAWYEAELRALASQPYFSRLSGNVSVRLGETAYLPCRAKDLQDSYMVTWMRVADVSVLSVGALTFSSDARLKVIHVPRPRIQADDLTLVISSSQAKDAGTYECSVNTLPKISHAVHLTVREVPLQDAPAPALPASSRRTGLEDLASLRTGLEDLASLRTGLEDPLSPGPLATISGPRVQFVSSGSTVGLECRVSGLPSPPLSLYWKRGDRVLTAKERPGISLESEKVPGVSTARLFLSHVSPLDSATYSCVSDLAGPASVQLVVTADSLGHALRSLSSAPSLPLPLLLLLPGLGLSRLG